MRRRAKIIRFPGAPEPPTGETSGEAAGERGLVVVHRCSRAEAMVVKSLFESEGIPTLLRSRVTHSVHPFTVGSQGEVAILVPVKEVSRTRALLVRPLRVRPLQ